MGLLKKPILNRLGSIINWNLNFIHKYKEINIFFFIFILNQLFSLYFNLYYFLKKNNINIFFKKNIFFGLSYFLKLLNWFIYIKHFFIFKENENLFNLKKKVNKTIFFLFKKKKNILYKWKI